MSVPRKKVLEPSDLYPPDNDYDPYASRETIKPLTEFRALANLVKSAVGTGLFAMPNAFASVGLIFGIVGTMLMGLLITISLNMLLKVHDKMCVLLRKPILKYLVDAMILICYVGVAAVYVVFVSGIVQEAFDTEKRVDQGYYSLILLPFFFLINMVKHLSDIAIVSVIGNLLLFTAAALGVVYALKDGISNDWVVIATDVTMYPKFIGTAFFSMSSPGIVLAIQHDMKNPGKYTTHCGILNRGMVSITLVHVFVGVVGYLKWGKNSLGNFIRNHPTDDPTKIIALAMQSLSICLTYGLQCYTPINLIYEDYIMPALEEKAWKGSPLLYDVAVRFSISLVSSLFAALIPRVDLFIGFVGAISTSILSTLIPVSLYILMKRGDYGVFKWKCIVYASLLIVGIFITLCAAIVSIFLIYDYCRSRY